jgi:hypothetical protein
MKNYYLNKEFDLEKSAWRGQYSSLKEYYEKEFGKKYKILDPATLAPITYGPYAGKEFPYYTFSPEELEIDPDEDPEDWTLLPNDSFEIKQEKLQKQQEEIVKCIRNFSYFSHRYIKIFHPIRGLVPFIHYNYQRRVIGEYDNHRFNIISKMRQAGLTTVTALWGLWRCMFRKDQAIMVMSKTDREAMTSAGMIARAIDWLPTWIKPQMDKDNDHVKEFKTTGGRIEFQGPEAARSKALTYMILDEAAHIPEMDKHWKAMYPTLSTGGNCIAISTVNGLGNWYQETYYKAQAGKNRWNIIELDFWEHPDYNDKAWVADQRVQLGEKGWQQEVMRSFLGSGETYIPGKVIAELDNSIRDKLPLRVKFPEWCNEKEEFIEERGALWIWREPIDGHEYTMAVDSADGVGDDGDNSSFQILDDATMEQVAEFYSNRVPPHIFSQIINEVAIYYNSCRVVVENNAPSGGAVIAGLKDTMMYENLYMEPKKKNSIGIKSNQMLRSMILESLQHQLLRNGIKVNSPRLVHELKTFIYNASKKRAEAGPGKHDDAIMALAIAIYIRNQIMKDIPVGANVPKEIMDAFKSEVYEEIKKEIRDGAPENWVDEEEDFFEIYKEDVTPGVVFNVNRRKFHRLLREFGW